MDKRAHTRMTGVFRVAEEELHLLALVILGTGTIVGAVGIINFFLDVVPNLDHFFGGDTADGDDDY